MKTFKITCACLAASLMLLAVGCESVGEEAGHTPIGSVIKGETRSAESYMERVRQENSAQQRSTWQPESPDRF